MQLSDDMLLLELKQVCALHSDNGKFTQPAVERVVRDMLNLWRRQGHARAVVAKLRNIVAENAEDDWQAAANQAIEDKTGWALWRGKVLLASASKQYGQPVTLDPGEPIPFNESRSWFEAGGSDHWFDIPLNTQSIRADTGIFIPGKLFTTRMPRGLDLEADADWSEATPEKYKTQGRTRVEYFEQNIKDHQISDVFVLVEPLEMAKVSSVRLLEYYRDLGLAVHHTPIVDFTAPPRELERKHIEDLNVALVKGGNCLVHCMGGTGRTGAVVIGAVQNLGINNAIKVRQFNH
jgi:hypothetical protein